MNERKISELEAKVKDFNEMKEPVWDQLATRLAKIDSDANTIEGQIRIIHGANDKFHDTNSLLQALHAAAKAQFIEFEENLQTYWLREKAKEIWVPLR